MHKLIGMIFIVVIIASCGNIAPATIEMATIVPNLLPISVAVTTPPSSSSLPPQSVIPTFPPDPIQVGKWTEYENALASALFSFNYIPDEFLCEWDILGQSDQEIYVWVVCMSTFTVGDSGLFYNAGMPAVIHVSADGSVQTVEIPGVGSNYESDIRRMFPPNAQEKYFNGDIDFQRLSDHLYWRLENPEIPPSIVLSATPIP